MEDTKVNKGHFVLLLCISLHFSIVSINHTKPTFQNYTPHTNISQNHDLEPLIRKDVSIQHNTTFIANTTHNNVTSNATIHDTSASYLSENTKHNNLTVLFIESASQIFHERKEVNIVSEWNLTHKRAKLSTMVVTLYFLGVVLGSLPAGFLADRFGRRVVMLTCFYCQGLLSIAISLNTSFTVYVVLRTLQGFFVQGLQNSSYTLLIELFPTRWRIMVAWMTEICWSFGLILLSIICYWFPNWRHAELISSVPFLILSLFYVWFIPESPRWKYTKNKIIEFEHLCNDESNSLHRNSFNEYTNEPGTTYKEPRPIKGLEYLSSENFISKHISDVSSSASHSRTVPNMRTETFMKLNDSFNSIKSDTYVDEFPTESLDSFGSIEDLRISLSSIMSEFDLTIRQYRKSFNIGFIYKSQEDKRALASDKINKETDDSKSVNSHPKSPKFNDFIQHYTVNTDNTNGHIERNSNCNNNNSYEVHEETIRPIIDHAAAARDKLLRELNKCVKKECCQRKTLDELLILIEQKRLTKNDVKNVCREIYNNIDIRNRLFIMSYLWFATSLSYYGVTFSLPALSGDRFENFCYGAIFEFISFSFTFFILSKVGRKYPLICFYLISSCLFIFIFVSSDIPIFHITVTEYTKTILVLLGKGTIVGTFFCIFIYCAELFPTPMRAACTGITSLCCRVGSLISPYLLIMAKKLSKDKMFLFLGILSLIASILTFCLPETHEKKLPDTIDDALQLKQRKTESVGEIDTISRTENGTS